MSGTVLRSRTFVCLSLLTAACVLSDPRPGGAAETLVRRGGDLQAALNAARPGDTILLEGADSDLDGLAVCHCGAGSEAGEDVCFVKFGAVRPGPDAADRFERLLNACEQLATEKGLGQLDAGMNLARQDAYRRMVDRGFRTWLQGVTMHKPNEPGYSHPDAYVIDDWR